MIQPITSALISVYNKQGIDPLIKTLIEQKTIIYSTGGTKKHLEQLGAKVIAVESLTGFPEILGGRVKTLHPGVFSGILSRRDNAEDINDLAAHHYPTIDLVIVDLYPFEETLKTGASTQEIIEKIDIGGVSLIRAAAKNSAFTAVISNPNQYQIVNNWLIAQQGLTQVQRNTLAIEAFATTSGYDTHIFNWFNRNEENQKLRIQLNHSNALRYGENPHQKGAFYGDLTEIFEFHNGKTISYNNLLDVDAAIQLIQEFEETTFAVLKHNNACGLASRPTVEAAWKDALAGDPISAFGGVLITNATIDLQTATSIDQIFYEVLIAPAYTPEALALLCKKKNRIVLSLKQPIVYTYHIKTILNGVIFQSYDTKVNEYKPEQVITQVKPSDHVLKDMHFAEKIVKHSKSNAITLVKNQQLIGNGVGQTSRIDALKHAIRKAEELGHSVHGAVLASDAFFPFADCVELAWKAGVTGIIQPGGSIKDQDSIDFCNAHALPMLLTGLRHFKH